MSLDTRSFRHWGGFIFSGGTAFVVDAGITTTLVHAVGFDPFTARLIAIVVAMVIAWLLHRRITFAVSAPPSLREFLRFAAVAWGSAALNYGVYAAILLIRPGTWPIAALIVSTGLATIFSYLGYRVGVFREPPPTT